MVDPELADLLERTSARAEAAAGGILDRLERIEARVAILERRSGALVIERDLPNGQVEVTAKRAGIDWRTWVATVGSIVVPIVVAFIMTR